MDDLLAERIDLWVARCQECDGDLLAQYQALLSRAERDTAARFRFERDRRRYVIRRAVVRTVLSRYATTPPNAWRFGRNAYGRPEIVNECEIARALSFNLSHSGDLIVFGVTSDQPLGVDVESIRETASMAIAGRSFTKAEADTLAATVPALRARRFFELWTLKEAYIKARGIGLSLALDSFGFDLSDGAAIRFRDHSTITDAIEEWRFWQFSPVKDFVIAVCSRHHPGQERRLSVRKLVPLAAESVVCCSPLRHSHDEDFGSRCVASSHSTVRTGGTLTDSR